MPLSFTNQDYGKIKPTSLVNGLSIAEVEINSKPHYITLLPPSSRAEKIICSLEDLFWQSSLCLFHSVLSNKKKTLALKLQIFISFCAYMMSFSPAIWKITQLPYHSQLSAILDFLGYLLCMYVTSAVIKNVKFNTVFRRIFFVQLSCSMSLFGPD